MSLMPTAIGLETGAARTQAHNGIQQWMSENGLSPYLPQLAEQLSYNIGIQYENDGLNWSPEVIAEVQKFPHALIFHYNEFHYKERPSALRWEGKPQDALTEAQIADYLGYTRQWLVRNGIPRPWMLVDEPPPPGSDRYTEAIEARVLKFSRAALASGWLLGVAIPNPTSFAFWADKLKGVRWILSCRWAAEDWKAKRKWPAANEQVWLYNRRDTFAGLSQQLRQMGATGYLHWSATWKELPLARIIGRGVAREDYEILPAMYDLISELQAGSVLSLESLDARILAIEAQLRSTK